MCIRDSNITGEFPDHLSKFDFSLLVLSTILIAAAGYIINDIFDITADEINKPESVVIGKKITEKKARLVYLLLNAVGISFSLYLAIKIEHPTMALVQVFIVASLWMYSSYYKRRILSGNFIIALLSALVLIVVGLFEPEFYRNFVFLMAYSGFAFFVSLTREIIKDMEDVEGDEKAQYKTLPVRFGLQKTKGIIYFNLLLTGGLIVLVFYQFFFINKVISFWYLLSMFLIPFLALTLSLIHI